MIKLTYLIVGFILGLITGIILLLSEFIKLNLIELKKLWFILKNRE